MEYYIYIFCVGMNVVVGRAQMFIHSPTIEHGPPPDCTSYSGLCHLSYKYLDDDDKPIEMLPSSAPICNCLDNDTCAIDWDNNNNTIEKALHGTNGMNLIARMSYCRLPETKRDCMFNEAVLTTRGRGPMSFEIVGDFRCNCERPLYPHSSWSDGAYDYIQYSCGKPRCSVMRTKVCALLSYKGNETYEKEYYCRCKKKKNEQCTGMLPNENGTLTYHWCAEKRLPLHM